MRRTPVALMLVLAALACGEGKAAFNIDVYSFLQSEDVDTIPYIGPLPPGVPDTIPAQEVQLLPIGLEGSVVDSVHVTATLDFAIRSAASGGLSMRSVTVAASAWVADPSRWT